MISRRANRAGVPGISSAETSRPGTRPPRTLPPHDCSRADWATHDGRRPAGTTASTHHSYRSIMGRSLSNRNPKVRLTPALPITPSSPSQARVRPATLFSPRDPVADTGSSGRRGRLRPAPQPMPPSAESLNTRSSGVIIRTTWSEVATQGFAEWHVGRRLTF
jgi:hypothetical protein